MGTPKKIVVKDPDDLLLDAIYEYLPTLRGVSIKGIKRENIERPRNERVITNLSTHSGIEENTTVTLEVKFNIVTESE